MFWVLRFLNPVTLNVIIKNIEIGKGSIVVGIYNNDKDFF